MAKRKPTDKQLYRLKNDILRERFTQVTPFEFYRDVFPEGSLGERGRQDVRKPNLIFTMAMHREDGAPYARNTIVFDDLAGLKETEGATFAITSPVSYRGRNRTAANAHHLWGFTIDLDGVGIEQITDLLYQIENKVLPTPTYLINSGHGLHVYYLLENPVPMYKHLREPLNDLKMGLTNIVWNAYTSSIEPEKRQFQGIFQGFRMPGTQSKLGKRYPVVAFRLGNKTSLDTLNAFVSDEYKLKEWNEYQITLDEAKEQYPKWYQRVVVEGKKSKEKWDIPGKVHGDDPYALYHWWLRKIKEGAFDGNRYNCIATLVTYGVKCDMDKEQVLSDALELVPWLNTLTVTPNNDFTEQDVYDAFTYYDDCYATYSIKAIEARTKIHIERNKRNGQKQADHLEEARAIRDIRQRRKGTKWTDNNGRPKGSGTACNKVQEWRKAHPDGRKVDCIRETGLSKKTVYKWWEYEEERQVFYESDITPEFVMELSKKGVRHVHVMRAVAEDGRMVAKVEDWLLQKNERGEVLWQKR